MASPPRGGRSSGHDFMPSGTHSRAVTTHGKPHAQQQLARDLEVERAAMGQRYRPQRLGPGLLCAAARFGFSVFKNNMFLLEGLVFTPVASATTKICLKTFFSLRTECYLGTRTAVQSWSCLLYTSDAADE